MLKSKKQTIKNWLVVLVLLLDDAAALALVFLVLWFLRIRIPLWVGIFLGLLLGALIFIIHRVVIPTFQKEQVTGAEGMVGLEGEVIKPLTPVGVVRVAGEYWKAKSINGSAAEGEAVEILGVNRLSLEVRRKEQQ